MEEDEAVSGYLQSVESTKFVIHFRRPTLLSTIHLANTQPFLTEAADLAFCHNGLFADFESYRGVYAQRLAGVADSEIGFCMLEDLTESGVPVGDALAMVYEKLGGQANLAALAADGTLSLYSNHERNRFWTFRDGDADVAATELHSPDGSLFNLIFPARHRPGRGGRERGAMSQPAPDSSLATRAAHFASGSASRSPACC